MVNNGGGGGPRALVKQLASVRPHPRVRDTSCLLFQSVIRIAGLRTAPAPRADLLPRTVYCTMQTP